MMKFQYALVDSKMAAKSLNVYLQLNTKNFESRRSIKTLLSQKLLFSEGVFVTMDVSELTSTAKACQ